MVQIKRNPGGVLLRNTNVLAAGFNLNTNPMDLSGIYTVKIVIRFSLGQSLFMGMKISLLGFLVLFSGKVVAHI